jgi:transcriptional regulator with XRE-family HTH domain
VSDSPDLPEELVGAALARWRKRRGIPGQALGDRVGMSQAKISRLENGVVNADPNDVRVLAVELKLPPAEVERLVDLAERTDDRLTDWRPTALGLADRQRDVGQLEATTTTHRNFQPTVVPGLLQTSEYARSIMSGLQIELDDDRIAGSAATVAVAVAARMERNQILLHPKMTFHFLMTESVLSNRVGEPVEMLGQIKRLREVSEFENVTVRIVPADADLPVAPYHGFYIADDRWVLVDLFNTSLRSRGRQTVRHYRRVFDAIERAAVADIAPLLDRYQRAYAQMLFPGTAA